MDHHKIINSIENNIQLCNIEKVEALKAIGRINAKMIRASMDIPNFSKSIYDGFAIHEEDYYSLSKNDTLTLEMLGGIGAGHFVNQPVQPGTTFYIMTGAEIPKDTKYIVPHERVKIFGNKIMIKQINPQLKTISYQGEQWKKGEVVARENQTIDRKTIFDITNQGYQYIDVYKVPKVVIISTGDEVKTVGSAWERGTIYNSTSYAIAADIIEYKGEVIAIDHVEDHLINIVKIINKWLDHADIIITTGGMADGKYDYTKDLHKHFPTKIIYAEIKKNPRIIISKLGGKWIINLSGSPRATFASLDHVIIPLLKKMMGLDMMN